MRMAYAVTNYELLREDKTTRAGILEEAKITQRWLLVRTMSRDERCFFFSPRPNSLVPAPPCSRRCSLDQPQAPTGVPGEGSRGPWTASQRFKGLQRAVVLMAWQNPTQQCNKAGQTGCFWMRLWIRYVIDNVSRIMWRLVPSSCRGRKLIRFLPVFFPP